MSWFKDIRKKIKVLKAKLDVLIIAYKDKRTPWYAKVLTWITIGYLLSPVDLVPDFIPVLGLIDDLLIVPLLIWLVIKLVPRQVMVEAQKTFDEQGPGHRRKNWLFGALVILCWAGVITWLFFKFYN